MTANVPQGCSESRWDDFTAFADALEATGDLDPASVVLRALADRWKLSLEGRVRLVLLWLAYDEMSSVLAYWERWGFPDDGPIPEEALHFPTSQERRGHRSPGRLRKHLEALGSRGKWSHFLSSFAGPNKERSWTAVTSAVQAIHGNGRWSAFKAGEMLVDVAGFPIEAPDCQHANSSGPRRGLGLVAPATARLLGSKAPIVARLDAQTRRIQAGLEEAVGYKVPMHHLESTLCDYQALVNGRYYIGHDIELQRHELTRGRAAGRISEEMYGTVLGVRGDVFPLYLLGEAGALDGHPDLQTLYRRTGRLIWWKTPSATWDGDREVHVADRPMSAGAPETGPSPSAPEPGAEGSAAPTAGSAAR